MHPLNQKLIEILPDLKELTFGCEVKFNRGHGEEKGIYLGNNVLFDVIYPEDYSYGIYQVTNGKFEILGRPIQLADVLRAIALKSCNYIFLDEIGRFYEKRHDYGIPEHEQEMRFLGQWNLSLGANDQPEETKQFILSILNK